MEHLRYCAHGDAFHPQSCLVSLCRDIYLNYITEVMDWKVFRMASIRATLASVAEAIVALRRAGSEVAFDSASGRLRGLGQLRELVGGGTARVRACAVVVLAREAPGAVPGDVVKAATAYLDGDGGHASPGSPKAAVDAFPTDPLLQVIARLSSITEQLAAAFTRSATPKCCCGSICFAVRANYLNSDMPDPVVGGEGVGSHARQKPAGLPYKSWAATPPAAWTVNPPIGGDAENPLPGTRTQPAGNTPVEAPRPQPPAHLFADGGGSDDPADRMPPPRGGEGFC
jgi:hypothetical protein